MGNTAPGDLGGRWPRRRALAQLVSALTYALPVGAAVGASVGLSRVLPAPRGDWVDAGDWAALVTLSSAVLLLVDRLARRLLPLAALLELSLLFPDHAPRRVAVARRAGSIRNLHARIEDAKRNGFADEPARAAVRIVELVGALHAHDRRTRGHSERVRALTEVLAAELRIGADDLERLRWSALLHDIGKVHVSTRILNKAGQLHPDEWEAIRRHPEEGSRLAAPLVPWLGEWAQVIVEHHERWDGSGYPHGLKGHEISYGARIVSLADAYEVMTASRSYKMPMSVAAARRELITHAGRQFDPQMVRAFLEVSIGRLRWITGPMSWAAEVPLLGWLRHTVFGLPVGGGQTLGQVVGRAAGVVGTAAGAVSTAVVVGALGVPASAPPAAAATMPPPPRAVSFPTSPSFPTSTSFPTSPPAPGPTGADRASPAPVAAAPVAAPGPRADDPTGGRSGSGSPPTTSTVRPVTTAAAPQTAQGSAPTITTASGSSGPNGPATTRMNPRRRRLGWVRRGLGQFTGMQGGLGQLKHGQSGV